MPSGPSILICPSSGGAIQTQFTRGILYGKPGDPCCLPHKVVCWQPPVSATKHFAVTFAGLNVCGNCVSFHGRQSSSSGGADFNGTYGPLPLVGGRSGWWHSFPFRNGTFFFFSPFCVGTTDDDTANLMTQLAVLVTCSPPPPAGGDPQFSVSLTGLTDDGAGVTYFAGFGPASNVVNGFLDASWCESDEGKAGWGGTAVVHALD